MAALREAFNQRIADLQQVSHNNESAMFNFAWFALFVVCRDLEISFFFFFFLLVSFQSLQTAEEEVEKMAAIAEQEKLKNINMEKQLEALGPLITDAPDSSSVPELQQALQDKDK